MKNSKGYEEDLFYPESMRTRSGIYVNVLNPIPEQFEIEDIAHALSMIVRFGGHLPIFYSVAEHCIWCARKATEYNYPDIEIYNLLMHDASEAYISDLISPWKKQLSNYYELEDKLMRILANKFQFFIGNDATKHIDLEALKWEWRIMIDEYLPIENHWKKTKFRFIEIYNNLRMKLNHSY